LRVGKGNGQRESERRAGGAAVGTPPPWVGGDAVSSFAALLLIPRLRLFRWQVPLQPLKLGHLTREHTSSRVNDMASSVSHLFYYGLSILSGKGLIGLGLTAKRRSV